MPLHLTLARAAAAIVDRVPLLEAPFRASAHVARPFKPARIVYGHAAAALARRWASRGAHYRTVRVAGRALVLDVSEFYAHDRYFWGTPFEPGLTEFVGSWLRHGDTFVDAGANHGYFSVLAALVVGDTGRVIAFEPHDGARAKLLETLARNHVGECVEVVPMALSDTNGSALLHQAHHHAVASLVPDQSPVRHLVPFGNPIEVQTSRFDDWRAAQDVRRIRLMKIDVEGAEMLVLRGMPASLRDAFDAIVLETTPGSDADRLMMDAGYAGDTLDEYLDGPQNRRYVRRSLTMC
jgi:FkbM family methyltransferase